MSASPPPRHRRPRPGAAPRGRATSPSPIRSFLHAESGGAVVLVAAVAAALLWANVSPGSYASVWETRLAITLGDHGVATDLRGWVNEGLMTLFFLVVGLEAKRELDLGELRERTAAGDPRRREPRRDGHRGGAVPADQRRRRRRRGLGRRRLDRHRARARRAGAGHPRPDDPAAGLPAHARGDRRPRRAAGHRARLHGGGVRHRPRGRGGAVRCARRAALGGVLARPGRRAGRGRRSGSRCSSRASTR